MRKQVSEDCKAVSHALTVLPAKRATLGPCQALRASLFLAASLSAQDVSPVSRGLGASFAQTLAKHSRNNGKFLASALLNGCQQRRPHHVRPEGVQYWFLLYKGAPFTLHSKMLPPSCEALRHAQLTSQELRLVKQRPAPPPACSHSVAQDTQPSPKGREISLRSGTVLAGLRCVAGLCWVSDALMLCCYSPLAPHMF